MANNKKKSDHIRVRIEDKKKWNEYCKALGTPSPELFKKVMHSPKLDLNQKMIEELQKKEADLKRKLGLQNVI